MEVNWTQLLSLPDLLSHTCSQTLVLSQNTTAGGEWGQEWRFIFEIEESVICLIADANDKRGKWMIQEGEHLLTDERQWDWIHSVMDLTEHW